MTRAQSAARLDGTWVGGVVKHWVPAPAPDPTPAPDPRDLIVCPCGATLTEPCRTTGGNYTMHAGRVIPRRCRCGSVLPEGQIFCTQECRSEARAETYHRREQRTPTRTRRRAA